FLKDKISADIVAVATQDEQHKEHATVMMEAGYDLLLEKPIANNKEDCLAIYETSKKYARKVIVCHVLRYTPFYSTVKRIVDSGKLGEIVTIHASENVGYFHQAHSFVRGPWRNKKQSSPMILAKCCHDMDILRYLMGEKCLSVNSYGDLFYFNREHAPYGSAEYCSECNCEDCLYKAQKMYTEEDHKWCAEYFTTKPLLPEYILPDLKGTQYDRCVFKCDNDVVDHEVTIMRFANGKTACHTMTAFSKEIYRDIKIHGTKAELTGIVENNELEIRYFDGETEKISVDISKADVGGHMGGDFFMMNSLYKALNGVPAEGITYLDVSIESHLMSFMAEESRLHNGMTYFIDND
ncbi:MAG: Gfo/Idh/MocA family oxidoreductase, partial [Clostridia bacterium]|nr:Gfo/Idh/MocA family oxidoreductase [Clostridia bacterium]